jgi:hypothetical protein
MLILAETLRALSPFAEARKSRSFSELSVHFSPGDEGLRVKYRSLQVLVVAKRCSRVHPSDHGLAAKPGPNFHAEKAR